jgi:hypothetical protein
MIRPRFTALLLLMSLSLAVQAHTWLTQDTVDRMLGRIQAASEQIASEPDEPNAAALYELADAAAGLATLMNEEFAAHGAEQQELLLSAIDGAKALGVDILWSGSHKRFFYDGEAYREYVGVADMGEQDAEARFYLIETDFYLGDVTEEAALRERIAEKEVFLARYPDFRERARVTLFLGIDHRDLWRLCRDRADGDCADQQFERAAARFRAVEQGNPDEEIGEVGARLLGRLDAERAEAVAADDG